MSKRHAYWEGEPVSSTRIRRLIEHGRMPEAMRLLGRPYYLEGVVEKGKQLGGRRLAPTVNIAPVPGLYTRQTASIYREPMWMAEHMPA